MGRNNELTMRAGGTINVSSFVKIDTSADEQVLAAGAGDTPFGISAEWMDRAPGLAGSDNTVQAVTGENVVVKGVGNDCLLLIGSGGCTAGDYLKPDASGNGVTASSGDKVGAVALQTVGASAKARVLVLAMGSKAP